MNVMNNTKFKPTTNAQKLQTSPKQNLLVTLNSLQPSTPHKVQSIQSVTNSYMQKTEGYIWRRIKHNISEKVIRECYLKKLQVREEVQDYIYKNLKQLTEWVQSRKQNPKPQQIQKLKRQLQGMAKTCRQQQQRIMRRNQKIERMQKTANMFIQLMNKQPNSYKQQLQKCKRTRIADDGKKKQMKLLIKSRHMLYNVIEKSRGFLEKQRQKSQRYQMLCLKYLQELQQKTQINSNLNKQLKSSKSRQRQLIQICNALSWQLSNLKQQHQRETDKSNVYRQRQEYTQQVVSALQAALVQNRQLQGQLSASIKSKQAQQRQQIQVQQALMHKHSQQLQQLAHTYNQQIQQLQASINKYQHILQAKQQQLYTVQHRLQAISKQNQQLGSQILSYNNKWKQANGRVDEYKHQLDQMQSQYRQSTASLQEHIRKQMLQLQHLTSGNISKQQYQEIANQCDTTSRLYQTLQDEYAQLSQQHQQLLNQYHSQTPKQQPQHQDLKHQHQASTQLEIANRQQKQAQTQAQTQQFDSFTQTQAPKQITQNTCNTQHNQQLSESIISNPSHSHPITNTEVLCQYGNMLTNPYEHILDISQQKSTYTPYISTQTLCSNICSSIVYPLCEQGSSRGQSIQEHLCQQQEQQHARQEVEMDKQDGSCSSSQSQYIYETDIGTQYQLIPQVDTQTQVYTYADKHDRQTCTQQANHNQNIADIKQQLNRQIQVLQSSISMHIYKQSIHNREMESINLLYRGAMLQLEQLQHKLAYYVHTEDRHAQDLNRIAQLQSCVQQLQAKNSQLQKYNLQLLQTIEYANSLFNSTSNTHMHMVEQKHQHKYMAMLKQQTHKLNNMHMNMHSVKYYSTESTVSNHKDLSDRTEEDQNINYHNVCVSKYNIDHSDGFSEQFRVYQQQQQQQQLDYQQVQDQDDIGQTGSQSNIIPAFKQADPQIKTQYYLQNNNVQSYANAVARLLAQFVNTSNKQDSKMIAFITLIQMLKPNSEINSVFQKFLKARKFQKRLSSSQGIQDKESFMQRQQESDHGIKDKLYRFLTQN